MEKREIVERDWKKPTKVVLCIPSGNMLPMRTCLSLMSTMKFFGDNPQLNVQVAVTNHQCSILPWGRSSCAADALRMAADYMFWVDSDMWFPPETLHTLLSHDKDIVGCVYAKKTEDPIEPVLPYLGQKFEGLQPVPALAMGMCLIKADVFDDLEQPYFEFQWQEFGEGRWLGEDVVFSNKLRDLGHTLWCDFELSKRIGHVGDKVYTLNGFAGGLRLSYEKRTPTGSAQRDSLDSGSEDRKSVV